MTGLLIAAAILLVLLLILAGRVTVIFDYGEELYLKISYLMFTVIKIPARRRKSKKKDKKAAKSAKKSVKSAEEIEEKSENPTSEKSKDKVDFSEEKSEKSEKSAKNSKKKPELSDFFALVKLATDSVGKPLKRMFKRTAVSHLSVEIICGGDDAAKAALNFGKMNILVGNALGWIDSFFTLKKPDRINVGVDFQREDTQYDVYCEVRLSLAALLGLLFSIIGRAVKHCGSHKEAKIALKKVIGK